MNATFESLYRVIGSPDLIDTYFKLKNEYLSGQGGNNVSHYKTVDKSSKVCFWSALEKNIVVSRLTVVVHTQLSCKSGQ
jgi:hypothetical protein